MSFVIDASMTLSWYFDDEQSAENDAILERVSSSQAFVPSIWKLEVANSLRSAIRRRRIDQDYRDEVLRRLGVLPIVIDPDTVEHAWSTTLALSDRYDLTPYDAAYLELAQRCALPLASCDRRLRDAASEAGVELT